jgi:hypothetical protein
MKYSEIRPKLKTGDIILFSGKGGASQWIKWFCSLFNHFKKTKYSHIGMLVVESNWVTLFESTLQDAAKGVQLVPFSHVVKTYNGRLFVRQICPALDDVQTLDLFRFIRSNIGKPYEKHIIELMRSVIDILPSQRENDTDFFCSELMASVFQMWRYLPEKPPANEYMPQDFALGGIIDIRLKYSENPICLGKEIRIVL